MDHAALYDAARDRVVGLLDGADLAAPVAACPGWSVLDLVAHLAGGLGCFVRRDFDAGGYANHGERTVHERRGLPLAALLAEWEDNRASAGPMFDTPTGAICVAEIVSHEHDIRAALGRPGSRDDPGVRAGLVGPLGAIDQRLRADGAPAVAVVVDGERRVLGDGEPTSTLRAGPFELLRVIGGRRSRRQVAALDWDGEPRPEALTIFGELRTEDLEE